jgi:hypothetical protein
MFRCESGRETLEYAVISAILAAIAVLIFYGGFGQSVKNTLIKSACQNTSK